MEPEVQKLAITALVGLLLLFPVFNQVQATSLDALRDADHKAKFKDLLKDWDDIPEDEKLSYWDGRNKPPGSGDFDRDDVDDDARISQPPPGEPREGDRDGDGVPDEDDPDPDDPRANDQMRKRWNTVELWSFTGGELTRVDTETLQGPSGVAAYEFVNITWDYSRFTGDAEFALRAADGERWSLDVSTAGFLFGETESDNESQTEVPAENLQIEYDYAPLAEPNRFVITITGAYVDYVAASDADDPPAQDD